MYNTIQKCRAIQDETDNTNIITKEQYNMIGDCDSLAINITEKELNKNF